MLEMLKKTYLAGADLAHKTWDEVESLSKDLVTKAKMSDKEGSKFLQDMKRRYDDTQKKTGNYIEKTVKDILKKMDIATSADIKALKREITQLKKAAGMAPAKKRKATAARKRKAAPAKKRKAAAAKKRKAAPAQKRKAGAVKKRKAAPAKKRKAAAKAKK